MSPLPLPLLVGADEDLMTALFIPSVRSVIGKNISVVAQVDSGGGWVSVRKPALNLELPAFVACVKMHADPSQAPSGVVLADPAEMSPAKCLARCHDLIQGGNSIEIRNGQDNAT